MQTNSFAHFARGRDAEADADYCLMVGTTKLVYLTWWQTHTLMEILTELTLHQQRSPTCLYDATTEAEGRNKTCT